MRPMSPESQGEPRRRFRADRLHEAPAADRPLAFREVYDEILRRILAERPLDARALRLGANDKIAQFVRATAGGGLSVLEVGCGFGATALHVGRGQREMVGVDAAPAGIDAARRLGAGRPELRFEVMDATRLEFPDGHFDLVYSIDLIEHLHPDDVGRHLREARRVLRPGGCLIVKTPSELTGPHEGEDPGDQGFLHFREYRYGTLLPLLREAGFRRLSTPALSMRLACRLPGPSWFPASANLMPERIALLAPYRSRASRFLARLLGVKQVVIVARRD